MGSGISKFFICLVQEDMKFDMYLSNSCILKVVKFHYTMPCSNTNISLLKKSGQIDLPRQNRVKSHLRLSLPLYEDL